MVVRIFDRPVLREVVSVLVVETFPQVERVVREELLGPVRLE
jgi:hypothetical protein